MNCTLCQIPPKSAPNLANPAADALTTAGEIIMCPVSPVGTTAYGNIGAKITGTISSRSRGLKNASDKFMATMGEPNGDGIEKDRN
jgi:hypothetical protein